MDILAIIGIILASLAFGVGGCVLMRKKVHHSLLENHNETLGFMHSLVGIIYAVLLGFTVMIVWEHYRNATQHAEIEASYIGNLYRAAGGFSEPMKTEAREMLHHYTKTVIEKEWDELDKKASAHEDAREAYNRIWTLYTKYQPKNENERSWFESSIEQLMDLGDARRTRVLDAHLAIPKMMWVVLVVGAIITIGFAFLFGNKSFLSMLTMTAGLSTMIALVLVLVFSFNHPYSGLIKVTPEAFAMQLHHFDLMK